MNRILLAALYVCAVMLQSLATTIPLVIGGIVLMYIFWSLDRVFLIAMITGIILDVFLLQKFGTMSIFLLLFLGLVILYERKFEIRTVPFVLFMSFVGSFIYGILFGVHNILITSSIEAIVSGTVFGIASIDKTL